MFRIKKIGLYIGFKIIKVPYLESFKSRETISLLPLQNYTLLQNNRRLKRHLSDINILLIYMENISTI